MYIYVSGATLSIVNARINLLHAHTNPYTCICIYTYMNMYVYIHIFWERLYRCQTMIKSATCILLYTYTFMYMSYVLLCMYMSIYIYFGADSLHSETTMKSATNTLIYIFIHIYMSIYIYFGSDSFHCEINHG